MGSQTRTFVTIVFFTALVIGFAYVMPFAVNRAARSTFFGTEEGTPRSVESGRAGIGQPIHLEEPPPDNHGLAVRVAARCKVKGRAHGRLVRSVARDKEATEESARAACEQALRDQGTEAGVRGARRAKPDAAGKANDGPKKSSGGTSPGQEPESEPTAEPTPEPTTAPQPSEPDNGNGNAGRNGNGNGNGNAGGDGNGNGNGNGNGKDKGLPA